ncbi:hypothetical protein QBC40DRAFT_165838 [Triangularia verruculosa]|uniref:Protein kinase domain-containing protein n=1 Tax=Triangularia verruculosa TaxID=2587418 RepID=A0AAN6XQL8_9PEZI|nr:hypothetical protein QBC40DRAFT_165838 [Triangularia verruculosa]
MVSPSLDMAKEALFYLVPRDAESDRIVKENPSYHSLFKGVPSLRVTAGNKSKYPGRVLTIGRSKQMSDIVLYLHGMPEHQCSFQIFPAGELVLADATTGHHTSIRCVDPRGNVIDKYRLQGDPRRRVIPMDHSLPFVIWLNSKISFRFVWGDSFMQNVDTARKSLAGIAAIHERSGGAVFETQRSLNPAQVQFEPKSPNAPVVPMDLDKKPLRQTHTYKVLGEGAFGRVSLAVDLHSARLFAVKECKQRTKKADFKIEVEQLARLRHDVGGTLVYLGPEATRDGIMTRATDVYAFGLVLLEVLGRYCPREGDVRFMNAAEWRKKLETNIRHESLRERCRKYQDRTPLRNPFLSGFEARHGRVQSLSHCELLRPSVEDVLREDLKKRSTAARARTELLKDYEPKLLAKERKVVRDRR